MAKSSKKTRQAKPLATPLLKSRIGSNALPEPGQPKYVGKLANMAKLAERSGAINGRLPTVVANMAMLAGRSGTFNGRIPRSWLGTISDCFSRSRDSSLS
jgi:hypothetical protein